MGLVERWNNFAKKSIYINKTFEIGCGRLVFTGIIVMLQAIPILVMTGDWVAALVTLGGFLLSFKQIEKE